MVRWRSISIPKRYVGVGELTEVRFVGRPWFAPEDALKGVKKTEQRKGIRYERQASMYLDTGLDESWVSFHGQWIGYMEEGKYKVAQPDWFAVSIREGIVLIAEFKLTRTASAWWQLNQLYMPLLRKLFTEFEFALLEVSSKVIPLDLPADVRVVHRVLDAKVGETSFMKVPYNGR